MNKKNYYQQLAINAAKVEDWSNAIQYNQAILELDDQDTHAHNRLGVAFLQAGEKNKAADAFKTVLSIDKSNSIAKKHLEKLKQNQTISLPSFSTDHFIEEPGKTKTVELHRLASKDVLQILTVGTLCELIPKNRYISVEVNGQYVGALPEDLSFRLTKLINSGNTYTCRIRSVNGSTCSVFLKELKRSKKNELKNSFPLSKTQLTSITDLDDAFLDEDVPVQIVETDNDEEKSFDEEDMVQNEAEE